MGLFDEQISRKPNLYPFTDKFISAMNNNHWTVDIFDFSSDLHQFKTELSAIEQDIVVKTLSAIGQIEIAVKKFWSKLGDNLPHPSMTDMGLTFAAVEVIHNNAYEKLLRVLNLEHVFEENLKLDIVKGRVNYLKKYNDKVYTDQKKQYIYSIILFSLFIENVSLFSQFYIINWFNRYKNVLKDTSQQIDYTAGEECYIEGTEVLTPGGWVDFRNIKIGDPVCQFTVEGNIENTVVLHKVKNQYTGEMIRFYNDDYECIVTPEHEMVYYDYHRYRKCLAKDLCLDLLSNSWLPVYDENSKQTRVIFGDELHSQILPPTYNTVYCITVPSGNIVTRYNKKTFVAGNCLHALAGIKIINVLRQEYPDLFDQELEDRILHEAREAFIAESKIIDWILGGYTDKFISSDVLKTFLANRINDSLQSIGFASILPINESLLEQCQWFDEELLGNNQTDFFHAHPTNYQKNNKTFRAEDLF